MRVLTLLQSYLTGILVEKQTSTISDELEVWLQNGRYVLHSSWANYSYDTLHRIFQHVFKIIQLHTKPLQKVLILGFGAGSVAHILVHEMNLRPRITGVEPDEAVIRLAKKYFAVLQYPQLNLICNHAAAFAASCPETFDLVISDVFVHTYVPEEASNREYLQHLKRLTAPGGTGMINFMAEKGEQHRQLLQLIADARAVMPTVEIIKATNVNTVLVWEMPLSRHRGK